VFETRQVTKRFGPTLAVDTVDFRIGPGEVVALLGENGAGKSTFAKMIAGLEQPDSGELLYRAALTKWSSPRDALRRGVAFIPQELALIPELTVAENIVLGRWPSRRGLLSPRRTRALAKREVDRLGVSLPLDATVGRLPIGDQQLVEIAKALGRDADVLVLDEPTAALTESDSARLFEVLRAQAASGVAVVFVSHRLDEVQGFSDRVCVFRNGRLVADLKSQTTTRATLVTEMLGDVAGLEAGVRSARPDPPRATPPILTLAGWTSDGIPALKGVDLQLASGEILGVYGLRGSGGEALAAGLGGRRRQIRGEMRLGKYHGRATRSPVHARALGIAYVPSDRKREGLVLGMSVKNNLGLLILSELARAGWVRRGLQQQSARALIETFRVRLASPDQPVRQLSGGNQQKVLLASRLAARPSVLVLHEPTRGVDLGARAEIHQLLVRLAAEGLSVLLVSTDVDEVVAVCDRIVVLRDGRLAANLQGDALSRGAAIGAAAGTGAPLAEGEHDAPGSSAIGHLTKCPLTPK
jgi:ribose transport system ATP-binding protein